MILVHRQLNRRFSSHQKLFLLLYKFIKWKQSLLVVYSKHHFLVWLYVIVDLLLHLHLLLVSFLVKEKLVQQQFIKHIVSREARFTSNRGDCLLYSPSFHHLNIWQWLQKKVIGNDSNIILHIGNCLSVGIKQKQTKYWLWIKKYTLITFDLVLPL